MDGFLNINKPSGKTSFSIVAMVKKLTGEKHVGHAGTLDPLATGILPVCIGQATRLVEYLMNDTKTYVAEIVLGVSTTTDDAEGEIVAKKDASAITRMDVSEAFKSFIGTIEQTPPMYSALKHNGKPLNELARECITVDRKPRKAFIESIEITNWQNPVATVEVCCGKGTYIRTLAHDLGDKLGVGGSLKSLVRTRCGIFEISESVIPDEFKSFVDTGTWESLLYPMDSILSDWPAVVVSSTLEKDIRDGKLVDLGESAVIQVGSLSRAYTQSGVFFGVLKFDEETKRWKPEKVFGNQQTNHICACGQGCNCHKLDTDKPT